MKLEQEEKELLMKLEVAPESIRVRTGLGIPGSVTGIMKEESK